MSRGVAPCIQRVNGDRRRQIETDRDIDRETKRQRQTGRQTDKQTEEQTESVCEEPPLRTSPKIGITLSEVKTDSSFPGFKLGPPTVAISLLSQNTLARSGTD